LQKESLNLKLVLERRKKNFKILNELSMKQLCGIVDTSIKPYCEYTAAQVRERRFQIIGVILVHITEEYQEHMFELEDPCDILERLVRLKRKKSTIPPFRL